MTTVVEALGVRPKRGPRMILNQCAATFIRRETWRQLDLYDLWRDFGRFPVEADLIDQDGEMMDAFRIFESERYAMTGSEKPLTASELVEILTAAFGGRKRQ